jgi:hypothetical protein
MELGNHPDRHSSNCFNSTPQADKLAKSDIHRPHNLYRRGRVARPPASPTEYREVVPYAKLPVREEAAQWENVLKNPGN